MRCVAVALSGGIDSLASLILLKKRNYAVEAVHALLAPGTAAPDRLSQICADLDVPLHVVDLGADFERAVMGAFLTSLGKGLTPNPCAICNRQIKFGALASWALQHGFDYFATGHYARLSDSSTDGPFLLPCSDEKKDQAYFLALVDQKILRSVLFPMSDYSKDEARAILAEAGIRPCMEKESQDICFIPKGGLDAYMAGQLGHAEGQICLLDKSGSMPVLGRHKGLWNYTIGQRKGLGIAWKSPLYVVGKDMETNRLLVAEENCPGSTCQELAEVNFFLPVRKWPQRLYARLRYRQPLASVQVEEQGDRLRLELGRPLVAAPGQLGVIYSDSGAILAGGIIC